jgi:hypothetical protein
LHKTSYNVLAIGCKFTYQIIKIDNIFVQRKNISEFDKKKKKKKKKKIKKKKKKKKKKTVFTYLKFDQQRI